VKFVNVNLWYCYFLTNVDNNNIIILFMRFYVLILFLPNGDVELV
jgi:hypothetical protein